MHLNKLAIHHQVLKRQMLQMRNFSKTLHAFATVDPKNLTEETKGFNLVDGEWVLSGKEKKLVDPMTGKFMLTQPDTSINESEMFINSLRSCPKSGLHNPFDNKERYLMLGEVCRKVVESMQDKEVWDFFIKAI